jgi:hypothetical protein
MVLILVSELGPAEFGSQIPFPGSKNSLRGQMPNGISANVPSFFWHFDHLIPDGGFSSRGAVIPT